MDLTQLVHPTAGGLACAIGAVVAGASLFHDGLRALRLRRRFARLTEQPLDGDLDGFAHVRGTVALESPLFSPLASLPCAGFQLELHTVGAPVAKTVEERRAFRVTASGTSALLDSPGGRWSLGVTAEREVAADEPVPGSLARLIERVPEASWWRRAGGRLRLVERALPAGAACHVVGYALRLHPLEQPEAAELVRTGTDGDFAVADAAPAPAAPALRLWPGEFHDFLLVSDAPPAACELAVPAWRTLGAFAGPALSMLGLLYLAAAADALRALGRL